MVVFKQTHKEIVVGCRGRFSGKVPSLYFCSAHAANWPPGAALDVKVYAPSHFDITDFWCLVAEFETGV